MFLKLLSQMFTECQVELYRFTTRLSLMLLSMSLNLLQSASKARQRSASLSGIGESQGTKSRLSSRSFFQHPSQQLWERFSQFL